MNTPPSPTPLRRRRQAPQEPASGAAPRRRAQARKPAGEPGRFWQRIPPALRTVILLLLLTAFLTGAVAVTRSYLAA